jgi:inositol phosphorylceramide mannosyltransferase catalytic subunit
VQAAIPRRIIQTGKSLLQSVKTRAMVSSLRLLNPDFEYLFFDDQAVAKFMASEPARYRATFDSFRFPIQKYDFFRYLVVYRYGGFYFDLDVLFSEGISILLTSGCVFPFEGLTFSRFLRNEYNMDWEIGNYGFGAAAGHPFLEKVIENCVRAQSDPSWVKPMMRGLPLLSWSEFYVLYTTGPGLVSRTLAENPDLARSVNVLFPDNVCDSKSWFHFGDFGVHMMEASWRSNKGLLFRRLASWLENREFNRLKQQSELLGMTRQHGYCKEIV